MTETRDPTSLLADDQRARAAAQREFDAPLMVVAGAGTGKTSILVARIVVWCCGPGWQEAATELDGAPTSEEIAAAVLEKVVAITFTEAAAAEMADRVCRAFADLHRGKVPQGVDAAALVSAGERGERAAALLAQAHRLQTRTIHSFCLWLLRRHPVEAGVDPRFEVDAEGLHLERTAFEVVEERLPTVFGGERDPGWLQLVAAGVAPGDVVSAVRRLVEEDVEPEILRQDPFATIEMQRLWEQLLTAFDELWRAGAGELESCPRGATAEIIRQLQKLDRLVRESDVSAASVTSLGAAVSQQVVDRLKAWARGKLNASESKTLAADSQGLAAAADRLRALLPGLRRLQPTLLRAAFDVLRPLLEQAYARMQADGCLTYQALLKRTMGLLESKPRVCQLVQRSIRQLLVDEFQDTDAIQCEIVKLLALSGARGQRPGLFIVGDPKQSIYGWRSADLAAYDRFVKLLEEQGCIPHRLLVNFRSAQPVLDEVERVVAPIMHPREGVQPDFEPLLACEQRACDWGYRDGGRVAVEHWVSWPPDPDDPSRLEPTTSKEVTVEFEAQELAAELRSLHDDQGVPWGEVGVLMRTTGDLDTYLEALQAAGIPYSVQRERSYYRRREIVEAAALVRWLIEPADQLALLTVLRSDVVGVPDAALLPLWRCGLPSMLAALDPGDPVQLDQLWTRVEEGLVELPDDAPFVDRLPHWEQLLRLAIEHLTALRRSLRQEAPALFVERLRSLWTAEITAAARYLGGYRMARMESFFARLEQELTRQEAHLAGVVRFLKLAAEQELESREPVTPASRGDAVQVMTIHGAKGLDFGHVFLVQLHKKSRTSSPGAAQTEVSTKTGHVELSLFGWPTPGFLRAEVLEEEVRQAEMVRLLYVAMTRAKDRLVLIGSWPLKPGSGEANASLLDLASHRGRARDLGEQAAAGYERMLDEHGVAWVLPGLTASSHQLVAPTTGSCEAETSPATIRRHARELARRRERAQRRMQRPISVPVSQEVREQAPAQEPAPSSCHGPSRATVAAAVGVAVHRVLETIDLQGDLPALIAQQTPVAMDMTCAGLDAALHAEARERLKSLLETLARGTCLSRLGEIADAVVARELPLLMSPETIRRHRDQLQPEHSPLIEAEKDGNGAVGFVAGVADLVYEDRETGRLVVVDYKTDTLTGGTLEPGTKQRYLEQGRHYARALQRALSLEHQPRVELWLLQADEIIQV